MHSVQSPCAVGTETGVPVHVRVGPAGVIDSGDILEDSDYGSRCSQTCSVNVVVVEVEAVHVNSVQVGIVVSPVEGAKVSLLLRVQGNVRTIHQSSTTVMCIWVEEEVAIESIRVQIDPKKWFLHQNAICRML